MMEGFPVQISSYFLSRRPGSDPHGLDGGPGNMRGQRDIGQVKQWPIRWNGLYREGLDGLTAELVGDQRVIQGLVIHQWASGRVDKEASRFHGGKLLDADHPPGFVGNARMKTENIRLRQQTIEADLLDPIVQVFDRQLNIGVADHDAAAEYLEQPNHPRADMTIADDTDCHLRQFIAGEVRAIEVA